MTSYNITQDVAVIGFEAYGFAGCQNPGKGRSPSLSATKQIRCNPKGDGGFAFYYIQNSIQFISETSPHTKWVES